MKVLVYGTGVIGSYLTHVLCFAGNDVTVLARGKWKEHLEKNGLRIRHHLQRRFTTDRPRVIGDICEDDTYDIVFAVMPYNKISAILSPLAQLRTPLVVMVGNNMSPASMRDQILAETVCPKEVLFGFQSTAGRRDMESGILICERAGAGVMDIGQLHGDTDGETKAKVESAFGNTGYKLSWQDDMEAYLICHLAAIMPIGYLAYACGCDLTASSRPQRRLMRQASGEALGMLKAQGIPIRPKGNDDWYGSGIKGTVMKLVYFLMCSSRTMGDLIACEHCRNAYEEMEMLDKAFGEVIARTPDFPMPSWNALKAQMPDWDTVRAQYARK